MRGNQRRNLTALLFFILIIEGYQRTLQRKALQQLLFQAGTEHRVIAHVDFNNALFLGPFQQATHFDAGNTEFTRDLFLGNFVLIVGNGNFRQQFCILRRRVLFHPGSLELEISRCLAGKKPGRHSGRPHGIDRIYTTFPRR